MSQVSSLTWHDNTRRPDGSVESSTTSYESVLLTAANFDAERAKFITLRDALDALSQGLLVRTVQGGTLSNLVPPDPAPSAGAQRELVYRVLAREDNAPFRAWSRQIPVADPTHLLANTEEVDELSAEFIAAKAAVEDYTIANGNTVTVSKIILVGRTT